MDIIPATIAPEFRDISQWVNSDPVSISSLKGKVVMIDCWTYTCIFCLRTLPVMRKLHHKYGEYGFSVISVHSAEYQFASIPSNINRAISKFNIPFPVAMDTKNKTWEAYGNMYWPKHILVDCDGFVRFGHAGYGGIADFEENIVELLHEAGKNPKISLESKDIKDEIYEIYGMHFYGIAPEICVGYSRLKRFGNNQSLKRDQLNIFSELEGSREINQVYLKGRWVWRYDGIEHIGSKGASTSAIIMKYNAARRVHAIMGTTDGHAGKAEIMLDGQHLAPENVGYDSKLGPDGSSFIEINWPSIYNLVKTIEPQMHEIEIIPQSDNFVFYTFVFG